ncbi:MAG: HAD-IA family hydrolase [Tranquillimonas sp.]
MTDPALVIFDMDGTLVDSQAHICAAMEAAFHAEDLPAPSRPRILNIVGLSLPRAVALLAGGEPQARIDRLVAGYKAAYSDLRGSLGEDAGSPLYPGARAALDRLAALDHVLIGVATGKSRRGLDHVIASHDLARYFVTIQVADDHPSKPHPSMILRALSETGVAPERAVMVGDTSYDMEMGAAAGIATLGVTWGYHPQMQLTAAGAHRVVGDFAALETALHRIWERA